MNLCDIDEIRLLLAKHGFRFSKSLGQNFLIDPEIPARIAQESGAQQAGNVLEIGPGIGCLTAELCQRAERVTAIELDRALLPLLAETLAEYENVQIVQGDAMKTDLAALCREKFGDGQVVACANLPYYITTPAISAMLESHAFSRITVMVQREVAQRICAAAGTGAYSAFSIYVQYHAQAEILFDVPSDRFVPRPKVNSAVLRLTPLAKPPVEVLDEKLYFALVRAAFNMRRKTLPNALMPVLGAYMDKQGIALLLESIGISAQERGEKLSLSDYARLTEAAVHARLQAKQQ